VPVPPATNAIVFRVQRRRGAGGGTPHGPGGGPQYGAGQPGPAPWGCGHGGGAAGGYEGGWVTTGLQGEGSGGA